MIFFTTAAICNKKIIINSFGADNVPTHLGMNKRLEDLEIPVRDDGAKFEGWYYSLNFDKQFKSDVCELEPIVINAKFDKCYCFTIRYGFLGCFGKSDNYDINYYIPSGEYFVKMTDFSKAESSKIEIVSDDNVKTVDFSEIGKGHHITIKDGDYIKTTVDSVFMFQRKDVDPKYVHYRID